MAITTLLFLASKYHLWQFCGNFEENTNLWQKIDKKKAPLQSWKNLDFKGLFNQIGAREGTRTPMVARQILSLVRLPISPHAHAKIFCLIIIP